MAESGSEAPQGGRYITLAEVAQNNTQQKIWIVLQGRVYDVTGYINEHPGGEEVLLEQGGRDATESFEDVGHSLDARELLKQFLIGEVHPFDRQTEVPNKSPSNDSSLWTVWLIPILGALVLGLMYRYYVMDGK